MSRMKERSIDPRRTAGFQAKNDRGDELVALFQEFNTRRREGGAGEPRFRILTDASGPFFSEAK